MAAIPSPVDRPAHRTWDAAAQAMRRAAEAVAHPGGPTLFDDLVRSLADTLGVATVFVAVFADDARARLRAVAAVLDGRRLEPFEYPLEGSPCARVIGAGFRHVPQGVAVEFPPGALFAAEGMDAYAAYPMNDSAAHPLGLLVAMDRAPIVDGALAEALLKIFAGRMAAELERGRADEALHAAALAVSSARGDSVFAELVRYLAAILRVETAFIARYDEADPDALRILAICSDGQVQGDIRYAVAGTPCATVLGQCFRAYPSGLQALFPDDADARAQGTESYAGHPLADRAGRPVGIVAVYSRRPLGELARIEAMLQIFAVRAGAEIERLSSEEALQRSAASYRAIFDASEDAIFIHDWRTGELLDVNPRACENYGYTRDELRRLNVAQISSGVPPYTADEALAKIALARLGRCPPFEWHRRNKDGSLHWDEVRLKPVLIDGRPHVIAFTREITAQKQALEALRASEEQYREIFNASADALILWDSHFRRVDVNPAYERIYGWSRDEVIGRAYEHMPFGDEYAKPRVELVRRALAGEACSAELEALRKNGERILTEVHAIPFRHRGEPHVLAIGRDITERKTAVARLRASEEQYRALFDSSADAMVLWSEALRIVDVNHAFTRLTGFARDDVVGRTFDASPIRGGHADERLAMIRGALAGREGQIETPSWRKDGSAFHIELRYVPVRFGGEPHALAIGRDITARLTAAAQHAELEAQLRQAQKMEAIGQLTGGIAHDFNNILTSVIGYLVLGEERAESIGDATLVRQLGQAHLAAQRARDLIAQMLAFGRRQRGARRATALAPLVQQSVQLLRSTLPSSIVLDALAIDAAPGEATPSVEADAVQLEQVLINLCINARDAMSGAGRIRIGVREAPGGGWRCASCGARAAPARWIELSVADSGCGIEADVMTRMFEPFYSTKEPGRGSGMGLAMVHGIVHEHAGHVRVDTEPGRGTTFRVMLPAADDAAPAGDAVAPGTAARQGSAPAAARGRMLVVEDEAMVGDYLAERLQAWGYEVVLHRDPQSALAWLGDAAHAADLLVTDHTMPQMTGLQLAERARALRPALPVVLVSGNAEPFDAAVLARCGIRRALAKPLDAQRLREAVGEALRTSRPPPN